MVYRHRGWVSFWAVWAVCFALAPVPVVAQLSWPGCDDLKASDFTKVTLVDKSNSPNIFQQPIELVVTRSNKLLWVERNGKLKMIDLTSKVVSTVGELSVYTGDEMGLVGIALDPGFEKTNRWIYLFNAPMPRDSMFNQVTRFTLTDDWKLKAGTDKTIIKLPNIRGGCCHTGGSMAFAPSGELFVSVGDNVNSSGTDRAPPINESSPQLDSRRSAANSNDFNGKILRILPLPIADEAVSTPGIGSTYTIPAGNLFPVGTDKTKPEIYTMGNRNPYTIAVDPITGYLVWGEVGPDNDQDIAGKAPSGRDEYNLTKKPGNFGWPLFVGENKAYNAWNYETGTTGPLFDAAAPVNNSKWNTGLTQLPPAIPAMLPYARNGSYPKAEWGLGRGAVCAITGPIYHYDGANPSKIKMPPHFNNKWFVSEFKHRYVKAVTMNATWDAVANVQNAFPTQFPLNNPLDFEVGPDGAFYFVEWSEGDYGGDLGATKISRIEYHGNCSPPEPKLPTAISLIKTSHETRKLLPHLGFSQSLDIPADISRVQAVDLSGRLLWHWSRREFLGDQKVDLPAALQSNVIQLKWE